MEILEVGNKSESAKTIKYLQTREAFRDVIGLRINPMGLSNDPVLFVTLREFLKMPNKISKVCVVSQYVGKDYVDVGAYIKILVDTLSIFNDVFINKLEIWDQFTISAYCDTEPLKNYFRNVTSFKKICPNFDSVTNFDLLQQLDLNQHVEKINLQLKALPDCFHDIVFPATTITKFRCIRIGNSVISNDLSRYIEMVASQPNLTKMAIEHFVLTPKIIDLLMTIIQNGHLKKLELFNYSLEDGASEYLNDLSKIILNSQLTSVVDGGPLSNYLLLNLNLATSLTHLEIRGSVYCDNFDKIISKLSKTNIINFRCYKLHVCSQPHFSFANKSNIEESWNKILSDNYSLITFCVVIVDDNGEMFELNLSDLTNRNKNMSERARFAKVKVVGSCLDY